MGLFDFFKKKKKEVKPYEFISNPPAAELTKTNKLAKEEKNRLDKIEREIKDKENFIKQIDTNEIDIDRKIKSYIKEGWDSCTIIRTIDDFNKRLKYHYSRKQFLSFYLAARKFRARGFKVKTKTIQSTTMGKMFTIGGGVSEEPLKLYSHELIIYWE